MRYNLVPITTAVDLEIALNKLGALGWRFVAIVEIPTFLEGTQYSMKHALMELAR